MERVRRLDEGALAWVLLGIAMCISTVWLMIAGKDLTFSGDDIFYYARLVDFDGVVATSGGVEYFFAPHNGHLQILGKLIYRGLFLTVGADYTVFRAMEIVAVLASVLFFFLLAKRRVRPYAALIPSVLLLFFGAAEGSYLWPFNVHTIGALAFGLAALLTLERNDRRGDIATCALLILSIATVEVGLAFAIGVGVWMLLREDRWRRAWVFALPLALFAIWWLWARKFGQSEVELVNLKLIPANFTSALAAVLGAIFGLNPSGPGVDPNVTGVTPWGAVLGGFAVVGLVYRIKRGNVPAGLWIPLAVLAVYWTMITIANRPPDSTRYLFVAAVAIFLIAAWALRGARITAPALIAAACLVALAIPSNIEKFYDERLSSVADAENSRAEYAMFELARDRVDPGYFPAEDPRVSEAGGVIFIPLGAGSYLESEEDFGSFAYTLDEVRESSLRERQISDATLVGALELALRPADPPADPTACPSSLDGRPGSSVFFFLEPGGVLLGSQAQRPVRVALGRFGRGGAGVPLGRLEAGEWADLSIPTDEAPDRWWVSVDGPVSVCPPGSAG
jgi:hypothetical protein